jgi:putative heme-binding domain-containing protein
MYLTVGGRGTQAALYRISYTGPAEPANRVTDKFIPREAPVRRMLEKLHGGKPNPDAVNAAWPHLGSNDRHVRFAARVAIEGQPVEQWAQRALDESDPQAAMNALLAVARIGGKEHQEPLLKALAKFPMDSLNEPLKLDKLRVIELSFIRQGKPSQPMVDRGIEKLSAQYPAKSFSLNRELSQLLVWLDAPDVVAKTLKLMQESTDPAEQIWYAYVLREAKRWTPEQRTAYFTWFPSKGQQIRGGNSLAKFVLAIRDLAMANVPADQKPAVVAAMKEVEAVAEAEAAAKAAQVKPVVVREFKQTWTMADLEPELPKASAGRNYERGKEIFASTQCLACHRFNGEGGGVGPDISAVASRFNRRDLLESMIEPSKVISEQYASYAIRTKKNETFVGQIIEENNDHVRIVTDPLTGKFKQIGATQIALKKLSPVSAMPSNLLDVLSKDEILDLLAYIESGGKPDAPQFSAAK